MFFPLICSGAFDVYVLQKAGGETLIKARDEQEFLNDMAKALEKGGADAGAIVCGVTTSFTYMMNMNVFGTIRI